MVVVLNGVNNVKTVFCVEPEHETLDPRSGELFDEINFNNCFSF